MKKALLYLFITSLFATIFSFNFIYEFQEQKEKILSKYQLDIKSTSLFIKENLKKYLQNRDMEILNSINSAFNNNFSSIKIEKSIFLIEEKTLISLADDLDKTLVWELSNLKIDDSLGQILISTQSDDLQKELLTIEGSIPNDINKNIVPSSDIYTFIPSKNFRNISSLNISFEATSQFDETKSSSAVVSFEKDISSLTNNQNENIAPKWFKELVPIYFSEEQSKVNNSLQNDAIFYINTNIEKVYFELFEEAKTEFFKNFMWFLIAIFIVLTLGFLYNFIKNPKVQRAK